MKFRIKDEYNILLNILFLIGNILMVVWNITGNGNAFSMFLTIFFCLGALFMLYYNIDKEKNPLWILEEKCYNEYNISLRTERGQYSVQWKVDDKELAELMEKNDYHSKMENRFAYRDDAEREYKGMLKILEEYTNLVKEYRRVV